MDILAILIVAFLVGIVVGLTGMGGGALMTPALIFLGISPTAAVANDLVAAAFSKTAGAATHWKQSNVDMRIVKWLVIGSVPSAFAGGFIINALGTGEDQQHILKMAIGAALIFAALTYTLRIFISSYKAVGKKKTSDQPILVRPLPTVAVGVVGGLLVGMTSVGAGSVIMVALLLLYPMMKAGSLVGTDLMQAVPLVIAAAVGHVITTGIDWEILLPLLVGSVPGSLLGARLAGRVHQKVIRRSLVVVLLITGMTLLGVPSKVGIVLGVMALLIGPSIMDYPVQAKQRRHEASAASDDF